MAAAAKRLVAADISGLPFSDVITSKRLMLSGKNEFEPSWSLLRKPLNDPHFPQRLSRGRVGGGGGVWAPSPSRGRSQLGQDERRTLLHLLTLLTWVFFLLIFLVTRLQSPVKSPPSPIIHASIHHPSILIIHVTSHWKSSLTSACCFLSAFSLYSLNTYVSPTSSVITL